MVEPAAHSAQLPRHSESGDRIVLADNAVAVLDGASSYDDTGHHDNSQYVDRLEQLLRSHLNEKPYDQLGEIVSAAIGRCADELHIIPGSCTSPSSTVSIARFGDKTVEILALGDSPVIVGKNDHADIIVDCRLDALRLPEFHTYARRLRQGHGFDRVHRDLIAQLQRNQLNYRNKPDGYWIAEANPHAAQHAVTTTLPISEVSWVILATDGAADTLSSLGVAWSEVAVMDSDQLLDLLERCHRWEREVDPDATMQPRAKRHDDKTIVVVPGPWHSY